MLVPFPYDSGRGWWDWTTSIWRVTFFGNVYLQGKSIMKKREMESKERMFVKDNNKSKRKREMEVNGLTF
jgi:hypothetical protein